MSTTTKETIDGIEWEFTRAIVAGFGPVVYVDLNAVARCDAQGRRWGYVTRDSHQPLNEHRPMGNSLVAAARKLIDA